MRQKSRPVSGKGSGRAEAVARRPDWDGLETGSMGVLEPPGRASVQAARQHPWQTREPALHKGSDGLRQPVSGCRARMRPRAAGAAWGLTTTPWQADHLRPWCRVARAAKPGAGPHDLPEPYRLS